MTAHGHIFGNAVTWDEGNQVYRYQDGALASGWGGKPRPCPQCGDLPTAEGYDPCLGHILGAYSACCGHGVEDGEILWSHLRPHPSQLRAYRQSLGLTLDDVAIGSGLTKGFLSQLETGKAHCPSLATARKLATFYGVRIGSLFPSVGKA